MTRRLLFSFVAIVVLMPIVRADDVEQRQFAMVLDGRRVGEYHVKITQQADGAVVMSGQGQMQYNQPGLVSTYRYRGSEVWKEGRLLRLDSTSGDDSKETNVSAVAEGDEVRITVAGQQRTVPGPVWVTTYWHLPSEETRAKALTILDADNGNTLTGQVERLGTGQVIANGRALSCMRYRLSGAARVDLWYDGQDRLVRQEWAQDGRRVVLELLHIKK
jgi:YD repeat-containing protein